MKYEKPEMELAVLEMVEVITVSVVTDGETSMDALEDWD